MKLFVTIFGSFIIATFIFFAYMAWYRDWGRKHYQMMQKYFPDFVHVGERYYILRYKFGIVAGIVSGICLILFLYLGKFFVLSFIIVGAIVIVIDFFLSRSKRFK